MRKTKTLIPAIAIALLLTASCGVLNQVGLGGHTYTFNSLPQNVDELTALSFDMTDPYAVAALTIAALTRYGTSSRDCMRMLDYLKGPESVSGYEAQFIGERLKGKEYKPFSFFKGAVPSNNYTPSRPYSITVTSTPYSFTTDSEGYKWCTLYVNSGGADNPRPIKLRQKKSTGEWFLNDIQCLSDIRIPTSQSKWD
ncbi:MAG: hypothetical protein IJJ72_02845 [Bacteroidales bacterium]|nr:hypothetical protein [Bacteroidales bacterium]